MRARVTSVTISKIPVQILPDGRMDTRNAAAYLGLAVKTLAMYRWDGTGPKFVKRGRVFYFRADLDAWLRTGGRVGSATRQAASARSNARPRRLPRGKQLAR